MERNLFAYVWRYSRPEQLRVLALVLAAMPFYFVSLDLPKQIVNGPIQGGGFDMSPATQRFMQIRLPFADWLGYERAPVLFQGFVFDRTEMLFALSFLFLGLVLVNGIFKFQINTQKGRMGERMLRRLRFELMDRVLRFPPPHFKRVKSAEVATMVNSEVEPLGGFIGDAFVQPVFLGGLAATALLFILMQSLWLGSVALVIVTLQAVLIPRLRIPILRLNKQRQLHARAMAGRVGEIVDGIVEVRTNDTSNYERAELTRRFGRIFDIRFEVFQRKFFVKFLNNFLAQVTPFLFYSVGGYLAITGKLDIGQLVAVIAAYRELPSPIRDLINWDQQRMDVTVKYEQIIEQFQPEGILEPALQSPAPPSAPAEGALQATTVSLVDETGTALLESASFALAPGERVAVTGPQGGGKEYLGPLAARLLEPQSGRVTLDGRELSGLPESITGQSLAYVGQAVYLFPVSVRDNVLYGLKHRAPGELVPSRREQAHALAEARRAGNSPYDFEADWNDYAAAGLSGPEALGDALRAALRLVEFEEPLYQLGLRGMIDPEDQPEFAAGILKARMDVATRLADPELEGLVELFHPDRFNRNATIAENILFGTPADGAFAADALARNAYLSETLEGEGLYDRFLEMGREIAETMIDLFADLPPDHPFFEQFSFIAADALGDYQMLLQRAKGKPLRDLDDEDEMRLLALPLKYVEARHRLGLVGEALAAQIVRARARFAENLPTELEPSLVRFAPDHFMARGSLEDNLLSGRIAYGYADAQRKIGGLLREVLEERGLVGCILEVGLDFNAGTGGKRLSLAERQKVGLARALLKRPRLLILDEALGVFDQDTQARIADRILAWSKAEGVGLFWILARPDLSGRFDKVIEVEGRRIVRQGPPEDPPGARAAPASPEPRQAPGREEGVRLR